VQLSEGERRARRLDAASVEAACRAFDEDGFVFVESVVDPAVIAACRTEVQADLARDHQFMEFPAVAGIGTSFFDFELPFADPEIVANPILLQLIEAFIGAASCAVFNTNVSKPGAERDQPVHVDVPSATAPGTTYTRHVSVHITLCDFNEENGSTELWPGTHRLPTGREDDLEEAAQDRPSVRANQPAGSLLLRNASVWHRGRVNHTLEHREMLSFYFAARGEPGEGSPYGRPLVIRRDVLETLPPPARDIWAINEIVGQAPLP
jgi:ectoine hydroxylase-related dioxygenase (phytanoyl-CoA dioxygenase family)